MVQNGSNMAPKSAQVGAMLGSKTVLDPSKSAQERTPKTRPNKNTQKERKKNLTDNEREARLHVTTWEELKWEMGIVGYFKQAHEHNWVIIT